MRAAGIRSAWPSRRCGRGCSSWPSGPAPPWARWRRCRSTGSSRFWQHDHMTLDPRPDQQTDPPTAMVAAGGAAGVFKGRLVIVSGTGYSGVFVYSPSPGTGKLKASMSNGGTDPYGNVFNPGVETFDNLGRTVTMANNALTWSKLTDTPDIPPFIAGDPSKANGNSIEISTAEGNVASNPAAITLYDSAAASGVVGSLYGFR